MTSRTRCTHADSQPPCVEPLPELQESTPCHPGALGRTDAGGKYECALLDAAGFGRVLGIARTTVYELHANERLPAPVQVGRGRRWVAAEIEAWLLHGAPSRAAWERIWPRVRKEVLRR